MGQATSELTVDEVQVLGNQRTETSIILREIPFRTGDLLAFEDLPGLLSKTRKNLDKTNLFLEINLNYSISEDQKTIDFEIEVKERWYWLIIPYVVLADRSFNEWWYDRNHDIKRLSLGADFKHLNFTGRSDQLTLKMRYGFVPLYQISYFRPYVDTQKRVGISGNIFFSNRKNMAYRSRENKLDFIRTDEITLSQFGGGLGLRYRKNFNHFHNFNISASENSIADTIATINPNYFGNGNSRLTLITMTYDYVRDYRDSKSYPLSGDLFTLSFTHHFLFGKKDISSINLRYSKFTPLGHKFYLENGLRARSSFPEEQNYFLSKGLGFGSDLTRGYALYVIDGQHFGLSKNSVKWKAFERQFQPKILRNISQFSVIPITLYPNVFLDFGYVKNTFPEVKFSPLSNKLLIGTGVGIDLVSFYNTNLRAYFSVNRLREKKLFFDFTIDL